MTSTGASRSGCRCSARASPVSGSCSALNHLDGMSHITYKSKNAKLTPNFQARRQRPPRRSPGHHHQVPRQRRRRPPDRAPRDAGDERLAARALHDQLEAVLRPAGPVPHAQPPLPDDAQHRLQLVRAVLRQQVRPHSPFSPFPLFPLPLSKHR